MFLLFTGSEWDFNGSFQWFHYLLAVHTKGDSATKSHQSNVSLCRRHFHVTYFCRIFHILLLLAISCRNGGLKPNIFLKYNKFPLLEVHELNGKAMFADWIVQDCAFWATKYVHFFLNADKNVLWNYLVLGILSIEVIFLSIEFLMYKNINPNLKTYVRFEVKKSQAQLYQVY